VGAVKGTKSRKIAGRKQRQLQMARHWESSSGDSGLVNEGKWPRIVGTCLDLEKSYFRLTSAPNPEDVRPEYVLKQSLEHLKRKWGEGEERANGEEERQKLYLWVSEQFKSLRQDMVVQHIRSPFTVRAYETHARVALENGDLDEFNQCLGCLLDLYKSPLGRKHGHLDEFLAYRVLKALVHHNTHEVTVTLQGLTARQLSGKAARHALQVALAYNAQNYHLFFVLYRDAPNMSAWIMDFLVLRVRKSAWRRMVKAYSPHVPLDFVAHVLAFDDMEDARNFAVDQGAVVVARGGNSMASTTTTTSPHDSIRGGYKKAKDEPAAAAASWLIDTAESRRNLESP